VGVEHGQVSVGHARVSADTTDLSARFSFDDVCAALAGVAGSCVLQKGAVPSTSPRVYPELLQ
jgi:hypothetical protein